jgi:hypothetical protein
MKRAPWKTATVSFGLAVVAWVAFGQLHERYHRAAVALPAWHVHESWRGVRHPTSVWFWLSVGALLLFGALVALGLGVLVAPWWRRDEGSARRAGSVGPGMSR